MLEISYLLNISFLKRAFFLLYRCQKKLLLYVLPQGVSHNMKVYLDIQPSLTFFARCSAITREQINMTDWENHLRMFERHAFCFHIIFKLRLWHFLLFFTFQAMLWPSNSPRTKRMFCSRTRPISPWSLRLTSKWTTLVGSGRGSESTEDLKMDSEWVLCGVHVIQHTLEKWRHRHMSRGAHVRPWCVEIITDMDQRCVS